jgi:hypothetical protein
VRFLALLSSVLSSGRAHLAARDGSRPDDDATVAAASCWPYLLDTEGRQER